MAVNMTFFMMKFGYNILLYIYGDILDDIQCRCE